MDPLRVPKKATPVQLLQPDGTSWPLQFFLAETSATHNGPERVSDLLNGTQDFLPALDGRTNKMTFLGRAGLAALRLDAALEVVGDEVNLPTEYLVEVTLSSGLQLRGLLTFVLPADRSRVIDYLNDGSSFFALVEETTVALINKRHVSRVELR